MYISSSHYLYLLLASLSTVTVTAHNDSKVPPKPFSPFLEQCRPPNPHPRSLALNSTLSGKHPDPKPLVNGHTGDALNVTRCYCVSPKTKEWGYYLQADYFNYHTEQEYQIQYKCANDKMSKHQVPECWDVFTRIKEQRMCEEKKGNKFCYEMTFRDKKIGPAVQRWWAPPWIWGIPHRPKQRFTADLYYFNNQKRSVDSKKPSLTPPPEMCEQYCAENLEGMVDARDAPGWSMAVELPYGRGTTSVCNRHDVYLRRDDMCWNCE